MHIFSALLFLAAFFSSTIIGHVVAIADGDTFTLLTEGNVQVKVRLHGIDAPEKRQDFGKRAKQELSTLIYGREVRVTDKGRDRYGRTIGLVYVGQLNINEEMLRRGMAWHYLKYDHDASWDELERTARESHLGLWSQLSPLAPWEWRAMKRNEHAGD
jgi:endonuclease YncB( thermonuclease family)